MTRRRNSRREFELAVLVALTVAAALAIVASCRGQCPGGVCPAPNAQRPPQRPIQWSEVQLGPLLSAAICRVTNHHDGHHAGSVELGTGTLIRGRDGRPYVLTCSHLFDAGVGRMTVRFAGGGETPASIVARDTAHDVALLATNAAATPVAHAEYQNDRTLVAAGLGGDGRLRAVRGDAAGKSTPNGARYPSVVMHGAVRPGDSGGPLLNAEGHVIGVVWGARGKTTYATVGEPLRELLERLPPIEATPHEPRVAANPPQIAPPPECRCECQCAGDCVQRGDLDRYATLADLQRIGVQGERSPPPAVDAGGGHGDLLSGVLAAAATALGIGGPAGVALFAAKLLLRRRTSRSSQSRGQGGPRRGRFPRKPATPDRPAAVRVEPAREPPDRR
ncbi:Serine protease Do-like HtrA [Posidoniimonas polymericola]|uniref:Serine protease Do-like HtrA n=1 Tax=Posidoniimonas polymericola TaxID=2528002 RepID=A0A5C5ZEJ7_9BACT|nr:serine protease [Posidoniimonas polymericola]TWT85575.1 Serine protease Do-like HtrA [Posidoniimonas polymericola]